MASVWLVSIYPVLSAPLWALLRSQGQGNFSALGSMSRASEYLSWLFVLILFPWLERSVPLGPGVTVSWLQWGCLGYCKWTTPGMSAHGCSSYVGPAICVVFCLLTTCLSKWTKLSREGGISFLLHFGATYSFWHSTFCEDTLSKWFEFESYRNTQENRL